MRMPRREAQLGKLPKKTDIVRRITTARTRAGRCDENRQHEQPAEAVAPGDEPDILTVGYLTYGWKGRHTSSPSAPPLSPTSKTKRHPRTGAFPIITT